ncbi:hypothetical protein OG900_28510 [Streptomyces sp. NBC_00433]
MRPTRNRATGYLAVTAVGALIGASVAVGVGTSGSLPRLADIGAWLSSSDKGEATHADGLTGDVDGKTQLPGTRRHEVSISQDGKTVLVLDRTTGKVVRIDPAQLTAEQSADYGASGLQLASGGSYAYVVDPLKGTVQRIDPVMTTPVGTPVTLKPHLGAAGVDDKGVLWVPVPDDGTVVPFVNGVRSTPVKVSPARHDLLLTLAGGTPVVTDRTAGVVKVVSLSGTRQTFNLQGGIAGSAPATVLVPARTDGSLVPILGTGAGTLDLVDIRSGQTTNAKVPAEGDTLGAPQVLGTHVYIPDESLGSLLVYDTASSQFDDAVKVTGAKGTLELFVRNGLLWVNDQHNAAAAVINAGGQVKHIGKYKTGVPSAPKKTQQPVPNHVPPVPPPTKNPPPPPAPGPTVQVSPSDAPHPSKPQPPPAPGPTVQVSPSDAPHPSQSQPPPHAPQRNCSAQWQPGCPEPKAPGTPQVQSGAGGITVTFAAASGVTPQGYVLKGAPADATVAPSEVGPGGPFTFDVRGGSCSRQYTFTVVAKYAGGAGDKESAPSAPARPCLAPGAPQNLQVTYPTGGHGGTLSWQAPTDAGSPTTYTVTGPSTVTTENTSHTYTGLANSQAYAVSVTASNAAGSSGTVGGTLDLTPPDQKMNITNNSHDTIPVGIRSQPTTKAGQHIGGIPGKTTPQVTVHCKTVGSTENDPYSKTTSDVWASITYEGTSGYVADVYLDARDNPAVWSCT